jgi:DNA modification methylase
MNRRPSPTNWFGKRKSAGSEPPQSQQHFDVWNFGPARDDTAGSTSYFGVMPPQVVENLLWLYTEPGDTVFDPFAGSGTTIDISKRMGRRVWASDRKPSTPTLPIHTHDITTGWPDDAPSKVDFTLLDPPYWQQAAGRYSDDDDDLGNQSIEQFMDSWEKVVKVATEHTTGKIAYIISPTQLDDGTVVDHAFDMFRVCDEAGLNPVRRIIVTYSTQQATGQQVTWARENRRLLKLYRDLVVFEP